MVFYLVIARFAMDDIPVRLFPAKKRKEAEGLAWRLANGGESAALDAACKIMADASLLLGADVMRFKDGVPVDVVFSEESPGGVS